MYFKSIILTITALFVLSYAQTVITTDNKCGEKEKATALLEVAGDLMNEVKDLVSNSCIGNDSDCGKREKSFVLIDFASNLVSEVKKIYPTCDPDPECLKRDARPMDCTEILNGGSNASGVYTIWPRSRMFYNKSLDVYCDMDTDGGGWTVIQRRGNFSTPIEYFFKDWMHYKQGFGNVTEEFWLGNDNIHVLSNQANTTIRFDLTDAEGKVAHAKYHTFWIEDEQSDYTLRINGYSGNAGDAMTRVDGHKFTTKDRDNDKWNTGNCAVDRKGAWWYEYCTWSNLNGKRQPGVDSIKGIQWQQWRENVSLGAVEIKLRSNQKD